MATPSTPSEHRTTRTDRHRHRDVTLTGVGLTIRLIGTSGVTMGADTASDEPDVTSNIARVDATGETQEEQY